MDSATRRILLLGGTGDAMAIARVLDPESIYSLAGVGSVPNDLPCAVRVGGFGGAEGLAQYIADNRIALVLDATHPYAAIISANARRASSVSAIPYWALSRPGWLPEKGDVWQMTADWQDTLTATASFKRPFFTVGREPLRYLHTIPQQQHWFIRCLGLGDMPHAVSNATFLAARGPFSLDDERALFEKIGCDVLITKNSGGAATQAKLHVARERGVHVIMASRPVLPVADRTFVNVAELLHALSVN